MATLYLIHFSEKYKHAQHYIGVTTRTIETRMRKHRNGAGARLLQVVKAAGISYKVARTWDVNGHPREAEIALKKQKNSSRYCPICNPDNYRQDWQPEPGAANEN